MPPICPQNSGGLRADLDLCARTRIRGRLWSRWGIVLNRAWKGFVRQCGFEPSGGHPADPDGLFAVYPRVQAWAPATLGLYRQ